MTSSEGSAPLGRLIADLEHLALTLQRSEHRDDVADLVVQYRGEIGLMDRLAANLGTQIAVDCGGPQEVRGRLIRYGVDWILLETGDAWAAVRLAAVRSVTGLSQRALGADARPITAQLSLTSFLRSLGSCSIRLQRFPSTSGPDLVCGVLVGVGRDFVEIQDSTPRVIPLHCVAVVEPLRGYGQRD